MTLLLFQLSGCINILHTFTGDVIVKVNDIDVSDFNSKRVRELLNAIPPGGAIVLLVQGPEGYTTYLHTGKYFT